MLNKDNFHNRQDLKQADINIKTRKILSDHRMLPSVISADDVRVFGVPRELVPYNTQQTTAKLTQNTSCSVFFCCFSFCLPY